MAERRMAEIVGQAQRFGQIFVQAERPRDRPPDLRDLQAVGQADPVMVAVGRDEDLRLMPKAPESDRMDHAGRGRAGKCRAGRAGRIGLRGGGGRGICGNAQQPLAEAHWAREWRNPVSLGIAPFEGVDANRPRSSAKNSASDDRGRGRRPGVSRSPLLRDIAASCRRTGRDSWDFRRWNSLGERRQRRIRSRAAARSWRAGCGSRRCTART